MLKLLPPVLVVILMVYCLVDAITAREGTTRHLGKSLWVFIVLLFPLVGSIAWLALGRPLREQPPAPRTSGTPSAFQEYDRPGRQRASDPVRDEEFLRQVRQRAEEQRRRAEQLRREEQQRRQQPPAEDGTPDTAC